MVKVFNFDLRELEEFYGVDDFFFQIEDNKAIVDNELKNDIAPDWDYSKGKICCTGILYNRSITIFISEDKYDIDFKNDVTNQLVKLSGDNLLFAFNKFMEEGNFAGDLCLGIEINEIKPFNAKGWNKDRFFEELKKNKIIPDIDIFDPFFGDAGLCIVRWQDYLKDKNDEHLKNIVAHNLNCLLKEALILKYRQFFINNWEVDEKNFMLKKKDDE
jgi:hypothetical protein